MELSLRPQPLSNACCYRSARCLVPSNYVLNATPNCQHQIQRPGVLRYLASCEAHTSSCVNAGREARPRALVCMSASPSSTDSSSAQSASSKSKASGGKKAGSWSERLLAVSKQNKPKVDSSKDVFLPERKPGGSRGRTPQGDEYYEGDDFDDMEPDAEEGGSKRLPAEMRCFDTARIFLRSGDGGNGCVAFRREKFVEHGGPAGGNGGRGGSVWAVVDPNLNSLFSFRQQVHFRAPNGVSGQGSNMDGADATDLHISVPPGTIIRRKDAAEDEAPLAELVQPGDKALLLVGGRGGRGNTAFKTSRNTAPTLAEKGEAGTETWVDLELKVVADVGIIGVPNAGKSTLLSVVTAAKPKIANYPFTTLVPNLGVCEMDYRTTVFADVPGLLEGAHEGLGLGHEFLRHVQRCRALVHVIDGTSPDPMGDFRAINLELELFNPELKDKPQVVAYNKVDLPDSGDFWEFVQEELLAEGVPADRIFPISAGTGQGVTELVRRVRSMLDDLGPAQQVYETNARNVKSQPRRHESSVKEFTIEVEEGAGDMRFFYVQGEAIERFAQMTNWDYYEAVKRFQRLLDVSGINSSLKARAIKEGDVVVIGDSEFEWKDDQSDAALYSAYLDDMRNRGRNRQGVARWPKAGP